MGIKKYRGDHHEFREFGWKFHDFWMKEVIKINSEKRIRLIERLGFNQRSLRVQLGAKSLTGCKLGLPNEDVSI
jgi:hypothetical protein